MNISKDFFNNILIEATTLEATDIHLCIGTQPIFRVNGILVKDELSNILNRDDIEYIVETITPINKVGYLNENKSVDFSFSIDCVGRFRCNIYSQRGTFAIAIRILPFSIATLSELGIPNNIYEIISKSTGLFLITGTTGSGKSTTLASMIDNLNEKHGFHILTIEDPIEYIHNHKKSYVTQREIGQDTKDYNSAMRSALREDPDVIMLGDLRDKETILTALVAAETGHLVLSTLHTTSVASTIDLLVDFFELEQQQQIKSRLSAVLQGILSQQLIRKKDKDGLALATEFMYCTQQIKNIISYGDSNDITDIIEEDEIMYTMEQSLARLVKDDLISYDDAILKCFDIETFKNNI